MRVIWNQGVERSAGEMIEHTLAIILIICCAAMDRCRGSKELAASRVHWGGMTATLTYLMALGAV